MKDRILAPFAKVSLASSMLALALLASAFLCGCCNNRDRGDSAAVAQPGFGRLPGEKLVISSTIDFLDYAFYDKRGAKEYYDLETLEGRIREMAEGGINRIYLRVNACGLCNYPTKVSMTYGQEGRLHWNDAANARRFARTLELYDPCVEIVRLGHKYGMEVWCWESLCDEMGGSPVPATEPGYEEIIRKTRGMPMLEPAYAANPGWQAMKRPDLYVPAERTAAFNAAARKHPVARILLHDDETRGGDVRIAPDEVEVYVSEDNLTYTRYTEPFQVRTFKDEKRGNNLEITGLRITQPYVKLAHPTYQDARSSIAVRKSRGSSKAFNTQGEEIPTVWSTLYGHNVTKETTGFNFSHFEPASYDYRHYQVGFCVGEPESNDAYYTGVAEFAVPAALDYRLRKFAELAAYDFDGYMINLRTHSSVPDPDEYGYNPEVIQATIDRCGKDPVADESAREVLRQIRAEAIAGYFKSCKALIGKRRLYISGLSNRQTTRYHRRYGSLKWLYERYFADGSVDGVIMMGCDFRDEFTQETFHGRHIALGVFREMANLPKDYDLKADMEALRADSGISEVELYETLVLSLHPEMFECLK